MDQRQLLIILADISGYTRFMLENQTAALHGQAVITGLIESILREVDIPLTLQEIEGDAVFLYAAHPGSDAAWHAVIEQVSAKLGKFFDAFIAQTAVVIESTPCPCAICSNSDQLGLKIIVHAGAAVFHTIAGRPQVSGADVILAHRLLKNTVPSNDYLLLSEAAYAAMGAHLPGTFERHQETYEGFGNVKARVRLLDEARLAARDALYELSDTELESAVAGYTQWVGRFSLSDVVQQLRHPIRPFTTREKLLMIIEAIWMPIAVKFHYRRAIPKQLIARGERRTHWAGPRAPLIEVVGPTVGVP